MKMTEEGNKILEKIGTEDNRSCHNCFHLKMCGAYKAASAVLKDEPINIEKGLAHGCEEFVDAKLLKNFKMGEQLYTR